MYYRRSARSSPWAIVPMAIIFLLVGIISFGAYASQQANIQQKQQQLDNGIVMCGDQQMQPSNTCEKYWSYDSTPSANNPGLDEGGNSYDAQRAENQQAIDKEKSSNGSGIWVGLLFTALGLLSFYAFIHQKRKQNQ